MGKKRRGRSAEMQIENTKDAEKTQFSVRNGKMNMKREERRENSSLCQKGKNEYEKGRTA